MNALLADIDDSFNTLVPATSASPSAIQPKNALSTQPKSSKEHETSEKQPEKVVPAIYVDVKDLDLATLCEGADEWDWNDMELDDEAAVKVCPFFHKFHNPARLIMLFTVHV